MRNISSVFLNEFYYNDVKLIKKIEYENCNNGACEAQSRRANLYKLSIRCAR